MTKPPINHDLYQILSLPSPLQGGQDNTLSPKQIKLAYHRALLKHHPDKANTGKQQVTTANTTTTNNEEKKNCAHSPPTTNTNTNTNTYTYTIDEITTAYRTLTSPHLRAEYDRSLRLDRLKNAAAHGGKADGVEFRTGLEVADLEDMSFEERGDGDGDDDSFWYRECRCGDKRGFLITEHDLEKEMDHGEIVVGCRGCSLWMKVLFAVEDDNGDGESESQNENGKVG